MEKEVIFTKGAAVPIFNIAHAVRWGDLVFTSGHVPRNPEDGVFVGGDIQNQTRRVFRTLASVLESSDSSLDNVIKATVYLRHIEDRLGFNEVWHEYYPDPAICPARTTIKAGDLAPEVGDVEIEVIAHVNQA